MDSDDNSFVHVEPTNGLKLHSVETKVTEKVLISFVLLEELVLQPKRCIHT